MSELQTARQTLETFKAELPDFERLVKDNEQAAETLRRERADLTKQAEAKGRVNVAREMLDQHRADIQSAQAEVARLEAEAGRAATLQTMATHAKTAQELREQYDKEMKTAVTQLEKRIEAIRGIKAGLASAREGFYAAGRELSPDSFTSLLWGHGLKTNERAQLDHDAAPILDALRAQGIDPAYVLTAYNPNRQYKLDIPNSPLRFHDEGELAFFISTQTGM